MKTQTKFSAVLCVCALAGIGILPAADPAAPDPAAPDPAAMAKMEKLMKPGENHKVLEPMVGKWKTTTKFWMAPGTEPQVSDGTSDNEWIMEGRFVQQDVKGTAMGKPFQGRGVIGYDNVREVYLSTWIDTMGTGITTGRSKYNPTTKTIEEEGSYSCPMTGEKEMKYRAVLKFLDGDKMVYEMYMVDPSGKEFKGMEITYSK